MAGFAIFADISHRRLETIKAIRGCSRCFYRRSIELFGYRLEFIFVVLDFWLGRRLAASFRAFRE